MPPRYISFLQRKADGSNGGRVMLYFACRFFSVVRSLIFMFSPFFCLLFVLLTFFAVFSRELIKKLCFPNTAPMHKSRILYHHYHTSIYIMLSAVIGCVWGQSRTQAIRGWPGVRDWPRTVVIGFFPLFFSCFWGY